MPLHDLACDACAFELHDEYIPLSQLKRVRPCPQCGGPMDRRWDISTRQMSVTRNPTVHPKERTVVWRDPKTGRCAYPPVNDAPMPERYRKEGYVREELDTLHKLDQFCKTEKVGNEKASMDGNGRGMEGTK